MRRLVWTSAVRADVDSIAEYHAATDPRIGDMIVNHIEEAPLNWRVETQAARAASLARAKTRTAHILVYEVHDDLLIVLRVVHTARNWP